MRNNKAIPDLIIVGAGLAGLSAALCAAEMNFRPIVFEQCPQPGGATARSEGFFNAVDPERQILIDVDDSPERHLKQLLLYGANRGRRDLAKTLCYEAPSTLKWLEQTGLQLASNVVCAPGSPFPRSHRPVGGGLDYIKHLSSALAGHDVPIMTSARVIELLINTHGAVDGVVVQQNSFLREIHSRFGVVLAAGGFCANRALTSLHCPPLDGVSTLSAFRNDGLMLLKAADIGAQVTHMSYFMCDYPAAQRSLTVLSHSDRFVLLDARGHRFIREDLKRKDLNEAILRLPEKRAWLVASTTTVMPLPTIPFSKNALFQTLNDYNERATRKEADPFGKHPLLCRSIPQPWALHELTPCSVVSFGGLCIDTHARVINRHGRPISKLAAAGEITGGIFGDWAAAGDSLAGAAVFGRIAARTLCTERQNR